MAIFQFLNQFKQIQYDGKSGGGGGYYDGKGNYIFTSEVEPVPQPFVPPAIIQPVPQSAPMQTNSYNNRYQNYEDFENYQYDPDQQAYTPVIQVSSAPAPAPVAMQNQPANLAASMVVEDYGLSTAPSQPLTATHAAALSEPQMEDFYGRPDGRGTNYNPYEPDIEYLQTAPAPAASQVPGQRPSIGTSMVVKVPTDAELIQQLTVVEDSYYDSKSQSPIIITPGYTPDAAAVAAAKHKSILQQQQEFALSLSQHYGLTNDDRDSLVRIMMSDTTLTAAKAEEFIRENPTHYSHYFERYDGALAIAKLIGLSDEMRGLVEVAMIARQDLDFIGMTNFIDRHPTDWPDQLILLLKKADSVAAFDQNSDLIADRNNATAPVVYGSGIAGLTAKQVEWKYEKTFDQYKATVDRNDQSLWSMKSVVVGTTEEWQNYDGKGGGWVEVPVYANRLSPPDDVDLHAHYVNFFGNPLEKMLGRSFNAYWQNNDQYDGKGGTIPKPATLQFISTQRVAVDRDNRYRDIQHNGFHEKVEAFHQNGTFNGVSWRDLNASLVPFLSGPHYIARQLLDISKKAGFSYNVPAGDKLIDLSIYLDSIGIKDATQIYVENGRYVDRSTGRDLGEYVAGNAFCYTALGDGWTDFVPQVLPSGQVIFIPKWADNSDLGTIITIVAIALAFTGAGAAIGAGLLSGVGVAVGAAGSISAIAATALGGAIISTGLTAIAGGDVSLKSFGKSFAMGMVGGGVSSFISGLGGVAGIAGISELGTVGNAVNTAVTAGLASGVTSVIFGDSFADGFVAGAVSSAASQAGVGLVSTVNAGLGLNISTAGVAAAGNFIGNYAVTGDLGQAAVSAAGAYASGVVSTQTFDDGSKIETMGDGTIRAIDTAGQVYVPGSNPTLPQNIVPPQVIKFDDGSILTIASTGAVSSVDSSGQNYVAGSNPNLPQNQPVQPVQTAPQNLDPNRAVKVTEDGNGKKVVEFANGRTATIEVTSEGEKLVAGSYVDQKGHVHSVNDGVAMITDPTQNDKVLYFKNGDVEFRVNATDNATVVKVGEQVFLRNESGSLLQSADNASKVVLTYNEAGLVVHATTLDGKLMTDAQRQIAHQAAITSGVKGSVEINREIDDEGNLTISYSDGRRASFLGKDFVHGSLLDKNGLEYSLAGSAIIVKDLSLTGNQIVRVEVDGKTTYQALEGGRAMFNTNGSIEIREADGTLIQRIDESNKIQYTFSKTGQLVDARRTDGTTMSLADREAAFKVARETNAVAYQINGGPKEGGTVVAAFTRTESIEKQFGKDALNDYKKLGDSQKNYEAFIAAKQSQAAIPNIPFDGNAFLANQMGGPAGSPNGFGAPTNASGPTTSANMNSFANLISGSYDAYSVLGLPSSGLSAFGPQVNNFTVTNGLIDRDVAHLRQLGVQSANARFDQIDRLTGHSSEEMMLDASTGLPTRAQTTQEMASENFVLNNRGRFIQQGINDVAFSTGFRDGLSMGFSYGNDSMAAEFLANSSYQGGMMGGTVVLSTALAFAPGVGAASFFGQGASLTSHLVRVGATGAIVGGGQTAITQYNTNGGDWQAALDDAKLDAGIGLFAPAAIVGGIAAVRGISTFARGAAFTADDVARVAYAPVNGVYDQSGLVTAGEFVSSSSGLQNLKLVANAANNSNLPQTVGVSEDVLRSVSFQSLQSSAISAPPAAFSDLSASLDNLKLWQDNIATGSLTSQQISIVGGNAIDDLLLSSRHFLSQANMSGATLDSFNLAVRADLEAFARQAFVGDELAATLRNIDSQLSNSIVTPQVSQPVANFGVRPTENFYGQTQTMFVSNNAMAQNFGTPNVAPSVFAQPSLAPDLKVVPGGRMVDPEFGSGATPVNDIFGRTEPQLGDVMPNTGSGFVRGSRFEEPFVDSDGGFDGPSPNVINRSDQPLANLVAMENRLQTLRDNLEYELAGKYDLGHGSLQGGDFSNRINTAIAENGISAVDTERWIISGHAFQAVRNGDLEGAQEFISRSEYLKAGSAAALNNLNILRTFDRGISDTQGLVQLNSKVSESYEAFVQEMRVKYQLADDISPGQLSRQMSFEDRFRLQAITDATLLVRSSEVTLEMIDQAALSFGQFLKLDMAVATTGKGLTSSNFPEILSVVQNTNELLSREIQRLYSGSNLNRYAVSEQIVQKLESYQDILMGKYGLNSPRDIHLGALTQVEQSQLTQLRRISSALESPSFADANIAQLVRHSIELDRLSTGSLLDSRIFNYHGGRQIDSYGVYTPTQAGDIVRYNTFGTLIDARIVEFETLALRTYGATADSFADVRHLLSPDELRQHDVIMNLKNAWAERGAAGLRTIGELDQADNFSRAMQDYKRELVPTTIGTHGFQSVRTSMGNFDVPITFEGRVNVSAGSSTQSLSSGLGSLSSTSRYDANVIAEINTFQRTTANFEKELSISGSKTPLEQAESSLVAVSKYLTEAQKFVETAGLNASDTFLIKDLVRQKLEKVTDSFTGGEKVLVQNWINEFFTGKFADDISQYGQNRTLEIEMKRLLEGHIPDSAREQYNRFISVSNSLYRNEHLIANGIIQRGSPDHADLLRGYLQEADQLALVARLNESDLAAFRGFEADRVRTFMERALNSEQVNSFRGVIDYIRFDADAVTDFKGLQRVENYDSYSSTPASVTSRIDSFENAFLNPTAPDSARVTSSINRLKATDPADAVLQSQRLLNEILESAAASGVKIRWISTDIAMHSHFENVNGLWDSNDRIIWLKPGRTPSEILATLNHEWGHAKSDLAGTVDNARESRITPNLSAEQQAALKNNNGGSYMWKGFSADEVPRHIETTNVYFLEARRLLAGGNPSFAATGEVSEILTKVDVYLRRQVELVKVNAQALDSAEHFLNQNPNRIAGMLEKDPDGTFILRIPITYKVGDMDISGTYRMIISDPAFLNVSPQEHALRLVKAGRNDLDDTVRILQQQVSYRQVIEADLKEMQRTYYRSPFSTTSSDHNLNFNSVLNPNEIEANRAAVVRSSILAESELHPSKPPMAGNTQPAELMLSPQEFKAFATARQQEVGRELSHFLNEMRGHGFQDGASIRARIDEMSPIQIERFQLIDQALTAMRSASTLDDLSLISASLHRYRELSLMDSTPLPVKDLPSSERFPQGQVLEFSAERLSSIDRATIESMTPTRQGTSTTGAQWVVLSDGTKGIWKPDSENAEFFGGSRTDIARPRAEVGAYLVDQVLDINRIPYTTIKSNEYGMKGSFQAAIDDSADLAYMVEKKQTLLSYQPHHSFFDTLIGNFDRHKGNYLSLNGNPINIDHGASFLQLPSKAQGNFFLRIEDVRSGEFFTTEQKIEFYNKPPSEEVLKVYKIAALQTLMPDVRTYEKLVTTSEGQWRQILGETLTPGEIKFFLENRMQMIKTIEGLRIEFGDDIFGGFWNSPLRQNPPKAVPNITQEGEILTEELVLSEDEFADLFPELKPTG